MTELRTHDTVRIAGERGNHIVEWVDGRTGMVNVSRTTGAYGRGRTMHIVQFAVAPDRVTLVRRGNRAEDEMQAFFAEVDALKAAEAKAEADRVAAEDAKVAAFAAEVEGMNADEMLAHLFATLAG